MNVADEKITVDGKSFRITELIDIITKHNRMAAKGIRPFLQLHQELNIDRSTADKILTMKLK